MNIETHEIEYKDFSKSKQLDKKSVVSKLFKEISAFANSKGGKIIVGKEDKTGKLNKQPKEIIEWLENDLITSEINRISDNLIIFKSEIIEGIITLIVQEADDVVSANIDFKGINKGDCYVRQNHQAKIAKGKSLKNLIEKKNISIDSRLNKLRKIVHHKFVIGNNSTSELNIFDSLVISLESKEKHINTLFDKIIKHQFICGYQLPISRLTTITMHIQTVDAYIGSSNSMNQSIIMNRDAFGKLEENSKFVEQFIKSNRDSVLMSSQLKSYIIENINNYEN